MNDLKFSVLMSVYYKEKPEYLSLALGSIFNQTLMPDEVVLVEDGPLTVELAEVINIFCKKYPKIMNVIKYKKNRGLGKVLHDGLLKCSNEIVFRMDSDDISIPTRFEKQIGVFKETDADVVGSNIIEYDESMQKEVSKRIVPECDKEIKKRIKKRNPMNHMTVGFKKRKVIEAGNYLDMPYFEDYYLWARMKINDSYFYNIQENLVNVRAGNEMIKRRGGVKYLKNMVNFEQTLLKLKIINGFTFIINIIERSMISIISNNSRSYIYKVLLRK